MAKVCNIDCTNMVTGDYLMLGNTDLTTWSIAGDDLPQLFNLKSGKSMFDGCTSLESFYDDLGSLENGTSMFENCTSLTAFVSSGLSALTDGIEMFDGCTSLPSFSGDLSSLRNGDMMFRNNTNLTNFKGNLRSLKTGIQMFYNCTLNAPSIQTIALTINRQNYNQRFDIGINANYISISDAQVKKDLGLIKHKGWDLFVNGNRDSSNYTLPKYAGCTNVNSVKTKDSNYKTNDIVSGVWGEHLPDLTNS